MQIYKLNYFFSVSTQSDKPTLPQKLKTHIPKQYGENKLWTSCCTLYMTSWENIGFLTNRAGRNKIPYHAENNSFPSGEAARERIIFQVVRNFISSQAIGQESYSYHFSNRPSLSISQKILKLTNLLVRNFIPYK